MFSGFVLFASGHDIVFLLPLVLASIIHFSSPHNESDEITSKKNEERDLILIIQRIIWCFILIWLLSQPEIEEFQTRIYEGNALFDWKLITLAFAVTICSITVSLRKVSRITDKSIYTYIASPNTNNMG
jgi:hypothetical protein